MLFGVRISDGGCPLAIHDAFELYGRPNAWTWDPRDTQSLMFAYPVGAQRDVSHLVFLTRVQDN